MERAERERIIKKLNEGDTPDRYYVYALCDPTTHLPFYIGKGKDGRVWQHEDGYEKDLSKSLEEEKAVEKVELSNCQKERIEQEVTAKHKRIAELKEQNSKIETIIIKWGLTENEAFMAESALINLCSYQNDRHLLTNVNNGHASQKEKDSRIATTKAMSDTTFLCDCAVERAAIDDIRIPMVFVRVDKSYQDSIEKEDNAKYLYDCTRGMWVLGLERAKKANYVVALYNGIVVAAYHVNSNSWYRGKEAPKEKLPDQAIHPDAARSDRLFFEKCDDNIQEIQCLIGKEIYFAGDEEYLKKQNTKYNYNNAGEFLSFNK